MVPETSTTLGCKRYITEIRICKLYQWLTNSAC